MCLGSFEVSWVKRHVCEERRVRSWSSWRPLELKTNTLTGVYQVMGSMRYDIYFGRRFGLLMVGLKFLQIIRTELGNTLAW